MKYDVLKQFGVIFNGTVAIQDGVFANTKSSSHLVSGIVKIHKEAKKENVPQNDVLKTNDANSSSQSLEERVKILEHKLKEEKKSQVIDPVLALPQVNFRGKYDTAPIYNQDQAMLMMRKNYEPRFGS